MEIYDFFIEAYIPYINLINNQFNLYFKKLICTSKCRKKNLL